MKKRVVFFGSILICDIIMLYIYTLLHECGHAAVGLLFGGKIDKLVIGLNAHVQVSGVVFTAFGEALLNAAGLLLPLIIFTCVMALYNVHTRPIPYHVIHAFVVLILVCSLLEWVVVPIASLFTGLSGSSDAVNFLRITRVHPLIVTAAAIILISLILLLAHKKGLFKRMIKFFI